jgi:hypothetical protein
MKARCGGPALCAECKRDAGQFQRLPEVVAPPIAPAAPARFPLRVMVIGHGRHGKDSVGDVLRDHYGAKFVSSSWFMAERVVFPHFSGKYASVQECYDDRANHRSTWFDLIAAYNGSDPTKLGRAIFVEHDLYVGNRNTREFNALKNAGVFDVSLWVDACERVEYREPRSSLTIEPFMCDYIVDNNGTPAELERNVRVLFDRLLRQRQDSITREWAHAALEPTTIR